MPWRSAIFTHMRVYSVFRGCSCYRPNRRLQRRIGFGPRLVPAVSWKATLPVSGTDGFRHCWCCTSIAYPLRCRLLGLNRKSSAKVRFGNVQYDACDCLSFRNRWTPAQAIQHELHNDAGFRSRNHKFFGGGHSTDRTAIGPAAYGIAPCVTRPIGYPADSRRPPYSIQPTAPSPPTAAVPPSPRPRTPGQDLR